MSRANASLGATGRLVLVRAETICGLEDAG